MIVLSELFKDANFGRFINLMHEGVVCLDATGKIILCNNAAKKILGLTKGQIIGSTLMDIGWHCIHEDGSDISAEAMPTAITLKTGQPQYNVVAGKLQPGRQHGWVLVNTEPVFSGENKKNISGVIVSVADITALKKKENELLEKENYLRTLINSIPDILFRVDKDGRFLDCKVENENLLAFRPIDFLGKTFYEVWPKDIADFHMGYSRKAFNGEKLVTYEYPVITVTGEKRFFEARIKKINEEEAVIICRDITRSKTLNDKIIASEKLLAQSQEIAHIGSWQLKIATGKSFWTDELYRISGLQPQGIEATYENYLKLIHSDDQEMVKNTVHQAYNNHQPYSFFHRIVRPDGDIRIVFGMGEVEVDEKGQAVKMRGVAQDVTEIKKAEESLKKLNNDLSASNKELEQFAYIISHDLQEPLRMVSNFLELLQKKLGGQLDDSSKQFIHFATDGAERMKKMIQDLLQYSRLNTNKEIYTATDLNEVMQYVTRVQDESMKKNQAVITVTPMPVITANKTLITQLILNLISNALKFCGDNPPVVEVSCTETQQEWMLYVKDNGIGIEPKHFEKIFLVFQRLHDKAKYPGTGIGLAICKRVVDLHKGKIWVESEPGNGSTFYFTIPKKIIYEQTN
ncbi:MAG TPA: PAS domain S-box protein [Chitinophagaceae bacterium]|nr:PAS domain S-box protein [Chitinophagaceae bacterium]